jgi:hypothetical protein
VGDEQVEGAEVGEESAESGTGSCCGEDGDGAFWDGDSGGGLLVLILVGWERSLEGVEEDSEDIVGLGEGVESA